MKKLWYAGSPEEGFQLFGDYEEARKYYNHCFDNEYDDVLDNGGEVGDEHYALLTEVKRQGLVVETHNKTYPLEWQEEVFTE